MRSGKMGKKKFFRNALAAVLSAAIFVSGTNFMVLAQMEDVDDFFISFPVDYDTYIRKGYGQTDYSKTADMIVDGRASSERAGVLRFCYGGGEGESVSALVENATQITLKLQVNQNSGAPDMALYGIADDTMKNSWRDSGMNYDTAKSLGILDALDTAAVPRLVTLDMENVSASELLYLDVTEYVKAEALKAKDGEDAVFCFMICGKNAYSSSDFFRIYSDTESGTSEMRMPTLYAYAGHTGYAMHDTMGLQIEKRYQVTEDFELPAVLGTERGEEFVSRVHWRSDTEAVIRLEEDGDICHAYVSRPGSDQFGDAAVTLTATVENGSARQTKNFTIYVTPLGVFASDLTNYVSNSSASTKKTSNPNGILNVYVNGSKQNVGFVRFDTSEAAFRYAPRIVLRLKPYSMSGAFTLTMTPVDSEAAMQCTEEMTWNSSAKALAATSPYAVSFEQNPQQKDWIEWDVTDYVHSVGDTAAFRLEISSSGTGTCMFYGNRLKYLPQLKLYNYESVCDAEYSVRAAAAELQKALDAMHSDLLAVSGDIVLPTVDKYGVDVSWEMLSEDGTPSEYISSDGKLLKQPSAEEKDVKVRIVANLSRADYVGEPITAETDALVLRLVSNEEAVLYNMEHLTLGTDILTEVLTLPKGMYGADIAWSSEPANLLEISGNSCRTVKRSTEESAAELVAHISKGEAQSLEKRFAVTILRDKNANLLYGRKELCIAAEQANDDDAATYYASDNNFSLEYIFPAAKEVNSVLVAPYCGKNITGITVLGSEDGEKWSSLGTLTTDKTVNVLRFDTVSLTGLRFDVTVSDYAGIYEVGAYHEAETNRRTAADIVNSNDFVKSVGIPDKAVSKNFTLLQEMDGAQISWSSSDENIICIKDGVAAVTQSKSSRTVTLTACVSLNGETAKRSFVVTVNAEKKESGGTGGGSGGGKTIGTSTVAAPPTPTEEPAQEPKDRFEDLSSVPWAQEAIYVLQERGIINGRTEKEFDPLSAVAREEFVKLLVSVFGTVPSGVCSFTDAKEGAWYQPYLAAAVSEEIVHGKDDGSFGIGQEITREDAAVLIARAMERHAFDFSAETSYADEAETSLYAKQALRRLHAAGIFSGDENGVMNPKRSMTRAEAAKIIYKMLELIS